MEPTRGSRDILVTTMNDVPGYRVTRVFGEVMGLTVRSRNIGAQFGASLKALAGGELKGMTKNLYVSRREVIDRMLEEARLLGANAVIAMRFDTSELGQTWTEICAYGTAATIEAG
ncbi:MAG: YbjQ family protein [Acidimicrobiales bacterium]